MPCALKLSHSICSPMNFPILLLSPSKGMDDQAFSTLPFPLVSSPFPKTSQHVWKAVRNLTSAQFKNTMKVSASLLPEVKALWNHPWKHFAHPERPLCGAHAYVGEAFKWLDLNGLSSAGLARAQQHLWVVSALYGFVQPGTAIAPYRLEMQAKLSGSQFSNLYQLWRPVLTNHINAQNASFVVNAMSGEYSKAIAWEQVSLPVLHVDFKQEKNGQIKSVSVFSKQARGAFVRWMLEEGITTREDALKFDLHNYRLFQQEDNKVVFLRHA